MATRKVIISSRKNLQNKYGTNVATVEKLLKDLVASDHKRDITTQIIYIDDAPSASKAGINAVTTVTRQSAKKAIDDIYTKLKPAYMVIFGSQDIFPFQEIKNPANDDDSVIPTDLPYACDNKYSTDISSFTGPTRVVGRIPDIPGVANTEYLETVLDCIINFQKVKVEKLMEYFAVTADVWKKSTRESISNLFGNTANLKNCPPDVSPYAGTDLKSLTHFYNCHGSPTDSKYYGQMGNSYPTAQYSPDLNGKVSKGTIIAAECCYGAELFDPSNEDSRNLSIANTYLKNKAIAFMGSSTIAYGPSTGNGLADLITQYFIKNIINGSSTGRALLEARQKFLLVNGPHLDPYELKTLAQFYLLGDPSVQVIIEDFSDSSSETVNNRRLNLFNKGLNLAATLSPSARVETPKEIIKEPVTEEIKKIFKQTGFTGNEEEIRYQVKPKSKKVLAFAKGFNGGENITYRVFIQKSKKVLRFSIFDVLVLKESGKALLGWKVYSRK